MFIFSSAGAKRCFAVFSLLFLVCGFVAAQENALVTNLTDNLQVILDIFTSPIVKGIACIFLIILCIGLVTTGRQDPEMFKKFIPWIIGTVLFMSAGAITERFVDTDNSTARNIMNSASGSR